MSLFWRFSFNEFGRFNNNQVHLNLTNGNENGILILFFAALIVVLTH